MWPISRPWVQAAAPYTWIFTYELKSFRRRAEDGSFCCVQRQPEACCHISIFRGIAAGRESVCTFYLPWWRERGVGGRFLSGLSLTLDTKSKQSRYESENQQAFPPFIYFPSCSSAFPSAMDGTRALLARQGATETPGLDWTTSTSLSRATISNDSSLSFGERSSKVRWCFSGVGVGL